MCLFSRQGLSFPQKKPNTLYVAAGLLHILMLSFRPEQGYTCNVPNCCKIVNSAIVNCFPMCSQP